MPIRHVQPFTHITSKIWKIIVSSQKKLILGQKVDQNLQTEIEFQSQFKITNCIYYPSPSNTIKHSLETSKTASLEPLFKVLTIWLHKSMVWIRSAEVLFLVCIFLFYPKVSIICPTYFWSFVIASIWQENLVLGLCRVLTCI